MLQLQANRGLRGKVAITAIAGRFPNAPSPSALWDAVIAGSDLIENLRDDELLANGVSRRDLVRGNYVRRGAFLADTEFFDAAFFSCTAREALRMDPQQRVFLELCHEALELSGNSRDAMPGRCAVFAGSRQSTWRSYVDDLPDASAADEYLVLGGNSSDSLATRVAYKLGCTGPALNIRTFCSGSLLAVHTARQQLLSGECDFALVGGACIRFPARLGYVFHPGAILSPDGRCYTFDARANGTIFADAVAVVTLRRLEDALQAGDPIHAVIAGSSVNNDGSQRAGFGAPSVDGQVEVVREALRQADVTPGQIGLLEAHGTGTPVGDSIEFRALDRVFDTDEHGYCALGSIKTNIGHADCASGIVGLIKAACAVENKIIPPTNNFEALNPAFSLDRSAFYIPTLAEPWRHNSSHRLAGVSSFGIGGTNVHVVIENAPDRISSPTTEIWHIVPISAKTDEALQAVSANLKIFVSARPELNLADVAYTMQRGRQAFGKRRVIIARSLNDISNALESGSVDQLSVPAGATGHQDHAGFASRWLNGEKVDWSIFYRDERRLRLALPTYRFARTSFLAPFAVAPRAKVGGNGSPPPQGLSTENDGQIEVRRETDMLDRVEPRSEVLPVEGEAEIRALFANALKIDERDLDPDTVLLELGADSLMLFEVLEPIKKRFGVSLTLRQFFVDLPTVRDVAAHIGRTAVRPATRRLDIAPRQHFGPRTDPASNAPLIKLADETERAATAMATTGPQDHSATLRIVEEQLRIMQEQLVFLAGTPSRPELKAGVPLDERIAEPVLKRPAIAKGEVSSSFSWISRSSPPIEDSVRKTYLEKLIPEYNARTRRSKQHAAELRTRIADSRSGIGFRSSLKEMLYPIVCEKFDGAMITDIDGNEYVDMTMGFGVHLLGHNPASVRQALVDHTSAGFGIGTRCETALTVASLISELTGMERVAFVNSGTEAIMNAVRTARAVTRKDGIVIFTSSYHGHWDAVLAAGGTRGDAMSSRPLSVGIPDAMVRDVTVLEFGSQQALDYIADNAGTLAAVLVEPVPTRDPGMANPRYLHRLREVSREKGVLLIFDEIVTGFRCHPAGVQGLFNVDADIATYGKTIGGGMPLGVIAGRAGMLDPIDGGVWNFGDDSVPHVEPTFFGGTFFQHPLAMAAAEACLLELKQRGPAFQENLNSRTTEFCVSLDRLFSKYDLPIRANAFSSFFRLIHRDNFDLLYYNLLKRGVYIWEWRCWFISDAHTNEQLAFVLSSFEESIRELRDHGILAGNPVMQGVV